MLLEALLIFSCLVAGFGVGCIYCGGRKTKEGTPSASHNSDYTAALRVMRSFLDTGAKFSIDCDFGDFEMYCRERLHSEEPNVA